MAIDKCRGFGLDAMGCGLTPAAGHDSKQLIGALASRQSGTLAPDMHHRRPHPVSRAASSASAAGLSQLVALLAALVLAACGGSGEGTADTSTGTAPAVSETSGSGTAVQPGSGWTPTETSTSGPAGNQTPAYGVAWLSTAFQRVNELRSLAGAAPLTASAPLDAAAQGHADWMAKNLVFSHQQTAGSAGFTGANPWDRTASAGYAGETSESMGSLSAWVFAADAAGAARIVVDSNVKAAYHRAALLAPYQVHLGMGTTAFGSGDTMQYLVMNLGRPSGASPKTQAPLVWPVPQATGVPLDNGQEFPSPVAGMDSRYLGHAASVHCERQSTLDVTRFAIVEAATGAAINVSVSASSSDRFLMPCSAFAVPHAHLRPGTEYRAEFDGFLDGVRWTRQWTFRTTG